MQIKQLYRYNTMQIESTTRRFCDCTLKLIYLHTKKYLHCTGKKNSLFTRNGVPVARLEAFRALKLYEHNADVDNLFYRLLYGNNATWFDIELYVCKELNMSVWL